MVVEVSEYTSQTHLPLTLGKKRSLEEQVQKTTYCNIVQI